MPQMANIVAKNAAAANVTFEQLTPSQGDTGPAVWELVSASTFSIGRPRAEMLSRPNADKTARKVIASLFVPYVVTDAATGLQKVVATVVFRSGEMTRPRNVPDSFVADAVAYWQSLNASTLFGASYNSGFAPV